MEKGLSATTFLGLLVKMQWHDYRQYSDLESSEFGLTDGACESNWFAPDK